MEYEIHPSTQFITKPEFIWRDLKLDSADGDIYSLVLNFGAFTGTYDDLRKKTGIKSLVSIQRRINSMVKKGLIVKRQLTVMGNVTRAVLCAVYTKEGKRADDEIEMYLNAGSINLKNYYNKKCIITNKKNKSGIIEKVVEM